MKTYLDCIPCFFKQALEAARLAGASPKLQKRIMEKVAAGLSEISLEHSPPEMGRIVYGAVNKITKKQDPYRAIKAKSNKLALKLYRKLKQKISRSKDRLLKAVELAIAGNIIDYGVKNSLNVEKELSDIMQREENVIRKEHKKFFRYGDFKKALKKAKNIMYLGDNAGEIVFDRILIEEIMRLDKNKKIFYAVKEKPIINDALKEDAKFCGIDKIAEVVSSGLDIPGTVLGLCSKKFLRIYKDADIIISKGQGNFEAFSDRKKCVFFLFMAKCPVVARDVKCNIGDVVLIYNKRIKK